MRLSETAFFIALIIFAEIDEGVKGQSTEEISVDKSSYLWKINSTPPSYLFGTIHIPYTLVWDSVSEDVKTAFNSARQAYFELGEEDPDMSCIMLPAGQKISQVSVQKKSDGIYVHNHMILEYSGAIWGVLLGHTRRHVCKAEETPGLCTTWPHIEFGGYASSLDCINLVVIEQRYW